MAVRSTAKRKASSPRKKGAGRKRSAAQRSASGRKNATSARKASPSRKKTTRKKSSNGRRKSANGRRKSADGRRKASGRRKYSRSASSDVGSEMREYKRGTARSGRKGSKVKSRKQAIAIGLSKARRAGKKVPPNPNRRNRKTS